VGKGRCAGSETFGYLGERRTKLPGGHRPAATHNPAREKGLSMLVFIIDRNGYALMPTSTLMERTISA
jgi:hypothetical protein